MLHALVIFLLSFSLVFYFFFLQNSVLLLLLQLFSSPLPTFSCVFFSFLLVSFSFFFFLLSPSACSLSSSLSYVVYPFAFAFAFAFAFVSMYRASTPSISLSIVSLCLAIVTPSVAVSICRLHLPPVVPFRLSGPSFRRQLYDPCLLFSRSPFAGCSWPSVDPAIVRPSIFGPPPLQSLLFGPSISIRHRQRRLSPTMSVSLCGIAIVLGNFSSRQSRSLSGRCRYSNRHRSGVAAFWLLFGPRFCRFSVTIRPFRSL